MYNKNLGTPETFYRLKQIRGDTDTLITTVSGLSESMPDNGAISGAGDEYILVQNASGVNEWVVNHSRYEDSLEPRGFTYGSRNTCTLSVDDSKMEFTISGTYSYWAGGKRFQIEDGFSTVAWDAYEGMHYFFFDSNGTLNHSKAFETAYIRENAYVGAIYWDADNDESIYLGDERHGCSMDWATHVYLHNVHGAEYVEGLALSDIVADDTGASDTHAQLGYEAGAIYDEDLEHSINAVATPANIPMFYKTDSDGRWRRQTPNDFPVIAISGGRLAYNQWTGATWTLTEVGNGDYVLTHLFATNDSSQEVIGVLGQNTYATVVTARAGAKTEMNDLIVAGMPFEEFVPIATIIYQTKTTYTNAVKARIVSTDEGDDYIDFRTITLTAGAGGLSDHGNLSGLGDDDHPQYLRTDGTRATTGAMNMAGINMTSDLNMVDEVAYFTQYRNTTGKTPFNIEWNSGNKQSLTLTQNTTLTFTDPPGCTNMVLEINQDATGGWVLTWPVTVKWPGGTAPALTGSAESTDIVTFFYNGSYYYGSIGLDFK